MDLYEKWKVTHVITPSIAAKAQDYTQAKAAEQKDSCSWLCSSQSQNNKKHPNFSFHFFFLLFTLPCPIISLVLFLSSPPSSGKCTIFCTWTVSLFTYLFMLSFVTSFLGLFPSKCQGKQSPITPLQKYPSFALKLGNWSWPILSFTLWWKKKSWWPLKVTKDQLHYCCFASDRCMPWELSTVLCSSGPFLILLVHRFLQPSNKFHG